MPEHPPVSKLQFRHATPADRTKPDAHTPCNMDRAKVARGTLCAYAKEQGLTQDEADTTISDLLGDVMHLCRINGIDFDDCIRRAGNHRDAETPSEQVPVDAAK